jgi:TonB family protein
MKALKFICMLGAILVLAPLSSLRAQPVDEVFELVDTMAAFSGCELGDRDCSDLAMVRFLMENIRYPEEAREEGIKGKIYVRFVIGNDGFVRDVTVLRSPHELLSAEAIRVVSMFPQFTPGTLRGKPVSVRYTLPVNFMLE